MKRKRVIRSGDHTGQVAASQDQADKILEEIARLYRERIRALYNNDQPTLQTIAEQIEALKEKLPKI